LFVLALLPQLGPLLIRVMADEVLPSWVVRGFGLHGYKRGLALVARPIDARVHGYGPFSSRFLDGFKLVLDGHLLHIPSVNSRGQVGRGFVVLWLRRGFHGPIVGFLRLLR